MYFLGIFAIISFHLAGFQRAGGWLLLTVWTAIGLLILWMYLKYVDRVWLADGGSASAAGFTPGTVWNAEAWTDDGRGLATRKRGMWRLRRWTVVPVPDGSA